MSAGHNQSRHAGCGDGGRQSVTLHGGVHLAVPSAPGLGWVEHTTSSAHVSERTLTGSVRSASRNTGNTSDGTTGTPRDSRGIVPSLILHSHSLTLVLVDSSVHEAHEISTKRSGKDLGKSHGSLRFILGLVRREDGRNWARSRHLVSYL